VSPSRKESEIVNDHRFQRNGSRQYSSRSPTRSVDDFDLVEFLRCFALRTAELASSSVVGIVLADQHDQLRFMAGSREDARLLELFQLQHEEGPCMDAFRSREPVVNTELAQAADALAAVSRPTPRRPAFRTVHAFPLRLRAQAIGALNIFGTDAEPVLADDDVAVLQSLADIGLDRVAPGTSHPAR
jgi:GAF domain-containing protein